MSLEKDDNPFFKIPIKMILSAWAAREAALRQSEDRQMSPRIVIEIKQKAAQMTQKGQITSSKQRSNIFPTTLDFSMPMPPESGSIYDMGEPGYEGLGTVDPNDLDGFPMDWNPMQGYGE